MKTATALLRSAESLGITLWVDGDLLRYKARQPISDGFKDRLREHKAEIINLLSRDQGEAKEATLTLPASCRVDCHGLEAISLPNEGEVAGCVHPITHAWKRLDAMTECPALEVSTAKPPALPKWCSRSCAHLHQLTVPVAGLLRWCCHETNEHHWNLRRLDTMKGCPMREGR